MTPRVPELRGIRMRRLATVVVVVVVALSATLAYAGPPPAAKRPADLHAKADLGLTNGFLTVFIDNATGRFTVQTGPNHPTPNVPVFYPNYTSYLTFRDGTSNDVWVNAGSQFFPNTTGVDGGNLRTMYNAPA